MNYFISVEVYNKVKHNKLLCRDMNFKDFVDKINPGIRFMWKYRNLLDWNIFTKFLKTESQLRMFENYINAYAIKDNIELSDEFVFKHSRRLSNDIVWKKQRSYKFIEDYIKICYDDKNFLKSQKIPIGLLIKYYTNFQMEDIIVYQKNLPSSFISYLLYLKLNHFNTAPFEYILSLSIDHQGIDARILKEAIKLILNRKNKKDTCLFQLYNNGHTMSYEDWLEKLKQFYPNIV